MVFSISTSTCGGIQSFVEPAGVDADRRTRHGKRTCVGAQEWAAFGPPIEQIRDDRNRSRRRLSVVRHQRVQWRGQHYDERAPYAPGGSVELAGGDLGSVRANVITPAASAPTGSIGSMVDTDGRMISTGRDRAPSNTPASLQIFCRLERHRTLFANGGVRLDRYFSAGSGPTIEGGWAHSDGNMFLTGIGRTQILGFQRPWIRSSLRTPKGQLSAGTTMDGTPNLCRGLRQRKGFDGLGTNQRRRGAAL